VTRDIAEHAHSRDVQKMKITNRRRVFSRISGLMTLFGYAVCAGLLLTGVGAASAQSQSSKASAESGLARLPGHVHMLALPRFDAGEAPNSLRIGGLELIIAKTPEQQRALDKLVADQQNPKSPQYHRWLTPADYGAQFGARNATIAALSSWLESNGLQVGTLPAGRGHLPFTGDKEKIEAAFHTQIHLFNASGEQHYANVSDPMIPAALKPMIAAARGLNDFYPTPGVKPMKAAPRNVALALAGHDARALASPDTFYSGPGQYPGYVGPTDFATMYNVLPLYQQGITGAGVTVAIAAQSDIDSSVLTTFWSGFAVAGSNFGLPNQQFISMRVPAAEGGVDPGQTMDGNEDEAYLDTEIVGALAPGAKLVLVRDKVASNAAQYIIDQNLAAVLNISFDQCEAALASANTAINAMWEQAVSQGITVIVSSGDAGVSGCTTHSNISKANDVNSSGFAVNGLASTPFDLAVGGTDFDPRMESTHWSSANQPGTLASALSHIPEVVWNNSCASPILADAFQVFDPIEFCNTATLPGGNTANPFIEISGSGGGISSCTTADSNGNCTGGYAQPSWEVGFGVGSFGGRAIPDVSMIASRWLMCSYDTTPCDPTQAPKFPPAATGTIKAVEGTSAAAPSVAAIIALLDQTQITTAQTDGRQGLVNVLLYQLALPEYQNPAIELQCDASQGAPSLSACVFFDVTAGSNAQPCSVANYAAASTGSMPASTCVTESGDPTGIMGVNGTQKYGTFLGLDVPSGLGSINAAALIAAVQGSSAPSGLAANASGQTVTLTWTADATATLGYNIYQGTAPGRVSFSPIQQNVTGNSTVVSELQFGQSYVFAIAAVSSTGTSPVSSSVEVTIVPAAPSSVQVSAAGARSLSVVWAPSSGTKSYSVFEGTSSGAEGTTPILTGLTGTSTTVGNLAAGQQYFFTVTAVDAGGSSTPSTQASGTVTPAAPTRLVATASNGTVSLAWAAAAGASSYNVYEGASMSSEGTVPVQTGLTSPSASVGGLHNGTVYFFQIAAVNAGGTSAASNEASATPTAPSGGGGGGGSMDWLGLGLLALLASTRRRSTSYLPRGWSRRWRRWSRTPCHPQITSNTTLSIRVVFHTAFPILLAAT
jgi:subtilase family serine protease